MEKGRLAAAARPHDPEELPFPNIERYAVEGPDFNSSHAVNFP